MNTPILKTELARRIEYADFEVVRDRTRAIQLRAGNPCEIDIRAFGNTTALMAPGMPIDFNKVWGLNSDDLKYLDEMIHYYNNRNITFALELIPTNFNEEMGEILHKKDFFQSGFHTAFYGAPNVPVAELSDAIRVEKIGREEVATFSQLFCRSLELPADIPENEESFSIIQSDPHWSLYIGYFGETPASFSMMRTSSDGIACLGMAGTIPQYRNRGLQTAMLHRRMSDAKENHCSLIVAQSQYGTASFRNLQRTGLHIAFTKVTWQQRQIVAGS